MVETEVDLDFLHKSKNFCGKIFVSSKIEVSITSYIGLHIYMYLFLAIFSTSDFIVS